MRRVLRRTMCALGLHRYLYDTVGFVITCRDCNYRKGPD